MKFNKKALIIFGLFMAVLMVMSSIMLRSLRSDVKDSHRNGNVVKNTTDNKGRKMVQSVKAVINEHNYLIELEQNETAQKFAASLPLSGVFSELNANEKYYEMPEALPEGELVSGEIHTGDVMLYGNDTLVIFYENFETEYSYTKIGHIADTANLKDDLGAGYIRISIRR